VSVRQRLEGGDHADLAVLLAIVSSLKGKPLPRGLVVFGEVGLAGEIRPAPRGQERLREAAKLGFTQALIPKGNLPKTPIPGIEVVAVERAAEALARSAVGRLTLIDLDHIAESNTNRQIHALGDAYGRAKVQAMAERIGAINPDCRVDCIEEFVDADNAGTLLPAADLVLDCIDQVAAKAALLAWCRRQRIAAITCGAAGGRSRRVRPRASRPRAAAARRPTSARCRPARGRNPPAPSARHPAASRRRSRRPAAPPAATTSPASPNRSRSRTCTV
jgi:hypothetical protein